MSEKPNFLNHHFGIFCTVLKTKSPCTSLTYKDFLLSRFSKKNRVQCSARGQNPICKMLYFWLLRRQFSAMYHDLAMHAILQSAFSCVNRSCRKGKSKIVDHKFYGFCFREICVKERLFTRYQESILVLYSPYPVPYTSDSHKPMNRS